MRTLARLAAAEHAAARRPAGTDQPLSSPRAPFRSPRAHGCYICWPLLDPSHDDVRADDRRRHTAAGPTDGRASGAAVRAGGPRRRRRSLHVEDVTLATPAAGRPAVQQHHHPHPHHRFTGPQKRHSLFLVCSVNLQHAIAMLLRRVDIAVAGAKLPTAGRRGRPPAGHGVRSVRRPPGRAP
jgi:hypothetical protein